MKENNNPEIQETFRFPHSPASKQPLLLQVNDDDDETYYCFQIVLSLQNLISHSGLRLGQVLKERSHGRGNILQRGQHICVLLCRILYYVKVVKNIANCVMCES